MHSPFLHGPLASLRSDLECFVLRCYLWQVNTGCIFCRAAVASPPPASCTSACIWSPACTLSASSCSVRAEAWHSCMAAQPSRIFARAVIPSVRFVDFFFFFFLCLRKCTARMFPVLATTVAKMLATKNETERVSEIKLFYFAFLLIQVHRGFEDLLTSLPRKPFRRSLNAPGSLSS